MHHALPCSQLHTPNEVHNWPTTENTIYTVYSETSEYGKHLGDVESVLYSKAPLFFGKTIDCYCAASIRFRVCLYSERHFQCYCVFTVPLNVELLQELALWSQMSATVSRTSATAEVDRFCSATELQQVLERRHAPPPLAVHRERECVCEWEWEKRREGGERIGNSSIQYKGDM